MLSIDSCVFDIGNVLVLLDFERAMAKFRDRCLNHSVEAQEVADELKLQYENGAIGRQQFVDQCIAALNFEGTPDDFVEIWSDIFDPNTEMEKLIERLVRRFRLFLLSNTNDIHLDYLRSRFQFFRHFQDGLYSYRANCSKPNPKIFEMAIDNFQLNPAQTLYIDDLQLNIDAAARLGLVTIRYNFRFHRAFEQELARMGMI